MLGAPTENIGSPRAGPESGLPTDSRLGSLWGPHGLKYLTTVAPWKAPTLIPT